MLPDRVFVPVCAQSTMTDSLSLPPRSETFTDHTHHFKLKEMLIPAAAFGASAAFVGNGCADARVHFGSQSLYLGNGWGLKQRENI